jgi:hypothetical protein
MSNYCMSDLHLRIEHPVENPLARHRVRSSTSVASVGEPLPLTRLRHRSANPNYAPPAEPEIRTPAKLIALLRDGKLVGESITWREEAAFRRWVRTDARAQRAVIDRLVRRGDYRSGGGQTAMAHVARIYR